MKKKPKTPILETLRVLKPLPEASYYTDCPLRRALIADGTPCTGNPSPETAAAFLGWPLEVCRAIALRFDGRQGPYVSRFAEAIEAGIHQLQEST